MHRQPFVCRVNEAATRTRSGHPEVEAQLQHNKLDKEYYKIEDDLLKQKVVDGGHEFWSIYLPCSLVLQVL